MSKTKRTVIHTVDMAQLFDRDHPKEYATTLEKLQSLPLECSRVEYANLRQAIGHLPVFLRYKNPSSVQDFLMAWHRTIQRDTKAKRAYTTRRSKEDISTKLKAIIDLGLSPDTLGKVLLEVVKKEIK